MSLKKYLMKGNRQVGTLRMAIVLALALALLIPFATTAQAQDASAAPTASGTFCVDGLVIDWKEDPIEAGWFVVASPVIDGEIDFGVSVTSDPSEEDDEKGQFFFDEDSFVDEDGQLISDSWVFYLNTDEFIGDWESVVGPEDPDTGQILPILDVQFTLGAEHCERIRFKMRETVPVRVVKIDADHNLLEGWVIYATPAKGNYFAEEVDGETDEFGVVDFNLTPGDWIFTEATPDDFEDTYYPVIPVTGSQELTVESAEDQGDDYNPEEVILLRFKNKVDAGGCIEVVKTDVPPGNAQFNEPLGLAGWEISVLRADGSEEIFGYTDTQGKIKFTNLPYGPYTVREETRVGWEALTPHMVDVTLSDSTCAEVVFENTQVDPYFCIEGYKLDANDHFGLPGWEMEANPLAKNGYEPENVFTDGLGYFRFELPANDYRIPGAKYEVCEEERDGWLTHTPTCYTVMLPKHPGACVQVHDFVNQQVGHTESGGKSSLAKSASNSSNRCADTHKVSAGEGLFSIGARYGVSPQAMINANSWVRDRMHMMLRTGENVCIP